MSATPFGSGTEPIGAVPVNTSSLVASARVPGGPFIDPTPDGSANSLVPAGSFFILVSAGLPPVVVHQLVRPCYLHCWFLSEVLPQLDLVQILH